MRVFLKAIPYSSGLKRASVSWSSSSKRWWFSFPGSLEKSGCWGIIKHDVCKAVSNFFRSGKLLKQVNSTFLELIPKVDNPEVFEEFRPISLCNVLVKKISQIFLNRLREVLDELVGPPLEIGGRLSLKAGTSVKTFFWLTSWL